MTELESWKADAFRLMAENLKLERQWDRLVRVLNDFLALDNSFTRTPLHIVKQLSEDEKSSDVAKVVYRARSIIAEIEAQKEEK